MIFMIRIFIFVLKYTIYDSKIYNIDKNNYINDAIFTKLTEQVCEETN